MIKIREFLPNRVWKILSMVKHSLNPIIFKLRLKKVQKNYNVALKKTKQKVRNGEKLKVVFFVIWDQIWKYEGVYRLMDASSIYEPIIVIIPYTIYGKDIMMHDLNKAYDYFKDNTYNVINTYDDKTDSWLDIKNIIKPDIVFFSNPYNLTRSEYTITNFLETLTCYVPYAFVVIGHYSAHYDLDFQNFLWKYFIETNEHKKFTEMYARNKGQNAISTGYPGIDLLLTKKMVKNPWKIQGDKIKKIIWAPHHTIDGFDVGLKYSNFLELSDFMFDLLLKYQDKIQIAFKPHPLLRSRLYKHSNWGMYKTDKYYEKWDQVNNGFLSDSDYIDLFLYSDALIHDCASFHAEYLYTNKPVMFVKKDEMVAERFNSFGQTIFNYIYQGNNTDDIIHFIENVVIKENDYMKEKRSNFVESVLMPPNGKLASENIFYHICNELGVNEC